MCRRRVSKDVSSSSVSNVVSAYVNEAMSDYIRKVRTIREKHSYHQGLRARPRRSFQCKVFDGLAPNGQSAQVMHVGCRP